MEIKKPYKYESIGLEDGTDETFHIYDRIIEKEVGRSRPVAVDDKSSVEGVLRSVK